MSIPVESRHVAPSGEMTGVAQRHVSPSGSALPVATRHISPSGSALPVATRHISPSGSALPVAARHVSPSGSALPVAARHVSPSGSALPVAARHISPSGSALPVAARHISPSALTAPCAGRHIAPSALAASDGVRARHVAPAALRSGDVRVLWPAPALRWSGGSCAPVEVRISHDLGSSLWSADLVIADAPDYLAIGIGAAVELVIDETTWALIIDEKQRQRPDGFRLKGLSPVALAGAPWALPRALGAVDLAHAACERVLGQPIDWRLPDWRLPDSAAALTNTPLALAQTIIGAVGGVLESAPDGALIARPRAPVSPPTAWVADAPVLTDAALFEHAESVGTRATADRFVISSGATVTSPIQIEVERDPEGDEHVRIVRAFPHPWRPVVLAHTGDAAVGIGPRVEAWHAHTETLEIVAGQARARYPIGVLDASGYRYVDLGAVSVAGSQITTAAAAYSQLDVAYRARAWTWRVTHPRVESIQFLALEP